MRAIGSRWSLRGRPLGFRSGGDSCRVGKGDVPHIVADEGFPRGDAFCQEFMVEGEAFHVETQGSFHAGDHEEGRHLFDVEGLFHFWRVA